MCLINMAVNFFSSFFLKSSFFFPFFTQIVNEHAASLTKYCSCHLWRSLSSSIQHYVKVYETTRGVITYYLYTTKIPQCRSGTMAHWRTVTDHPVWTSISDEHVTVSCLHLSHTLKDSSNGHIVTDYQPLFWKERRPHSRERQKSSLILLLPSP